MSIGSIEWLVVPFSPHVQNIDQCWSKLPPRSPDLTSGFTTRVEPGAQFQHCLCLRVWHPQTIHRLLWDFWRWTGAKGLGWLVDFLAMWVWWEIWKNEWHDLHQTSPNISFEASLELGELWTANCCQLANCDRLRPRSPTLSDVEIRTLVMMDILEIPGGFGLKG